MTCPRLPACRLALSDLFEIDVLEDAVFVPPAPKDHRRWSIEDSEMLEAVYASGVRALHLAALLTGHSPETIRRWGSAFKLR